MKKCTIESENILKRCIKISVFFLSWIIFAAVPGISGNLSGEISSIALINGLLIDGTGSEPVQNAVVIIQQDRIISAGPAELVNIPANAQPFDVKGASILPGFINAHVHQGYNEKNLKKWALEGVTTVRDLGAWTLDGEWFIRRDSLNKDPQNARLVAAGPFITATNGYPTVPWGLTAIMAGSTDEAIQKTESLLQKGADLIKISLESAGAYYPEVPVLSPESAAAVVNTAKRHGKNVSAHISMSKDIQRAIDAGVRDIAHIPVDTISTEQALKVSNAGIYWIPTLEGWFRITNTSLNTNHWLLENAKKNLGRILKAGGKIALGTDYNGTNFESGMPALEISYMKAAGMTPMQIIVSATKNAAYVCGVQNEIGTIESYKMADILVVKGNPLVNLNALTDTVMVIHNGIIIRK